MHKQPPQRRAALARRAHGREGDGADCEIEIGRGRDDGSVVAAELKDRTGEAGGETWADVAAHCGRTRSRYDRTRASATRAWPISRPPITIPDRPSGALPNRRIARSTIACVASVVSG